VLPEPSNQYLRVAPKVVDTLNYIVAYMSTGTALTIRRYDAGTASDLGTFTVATGTHELHIGWVENGGHTGGRLLVRHNGATLLDTNITGFGNVETSGIVLAGVSGVSTARASEIESLTLVP